MKEEVKFGFGVSERHCETDMFDSVEELIAYVQKLWDDKDNLFDDGEETIHVGLINSYSPSDFAPSLDDIADTMTDKFYCDHNIDDDADVQYYHRKEAEEEWKKFVNKYFEIPCTHIAEWEIGVYNLRTHEWVEKFSAFNKYVKEL